MQPIYRFRSFSLFLAAGTLTLVSALGAQTREKKPDAVDFPTKLKESNELFAKQEFSSAIQKLHEAIQIAIAELDKRLDQVMPVAEKFKREKKNRNNAANPLLGTMLFSAPFEYGYRGEGSDRIKVTVHRETALAKSMAFAFTMAAQDPNQEVIGYGDHKGLFKKLGGESGFELMVILWGKHVIQVTAKGLDEKGFFAMFNQAFIDAVAKILGR